MGDNAFTQDLVDYKRCLLNIKSRDLQSMAARMCRALIDFPQNPSARSVTATTEDGTFEVDRTGTVFDSMWNEHVGAALARVVGMDINAAIAVIGGLYKLAKYLTEFGPVILGRVDRDYSLTDDDFIVKLNELNEFFTEYNLVELASTVKLVDEDEIARCKEEGETLPTYAQLGFFLDQESLGFKQDRSDVLMEKYGVDADVFEFANLISQTDIVTQLTVINNLTSAHDWDGGLFYYEIANDLRSKTATITKLVAIVAELVLDMEHKVDEFIACARPSGAEDLSILDPSRFDPSKSGAWFKIVAIQPSGWTNGIRFSASGNYRLSFKVSAPYFFGSIVGPNGPIDIAVANVGEDSAVYLTDKITVSAESIVRYTIRPTNGNGSSFDSSYVEVFAQCSDNTNVPGLTKVEDPEPVINMPEKSFAYLTPPSTGTWSLKIETTSKCIVAQIGHDGASIPFERQSGNDLIISSRFEVADVSCPVTVSFRYDDGTPEGAAYGDDRAFFAVYVKSISWVLH